MKLYQMVAKDVMRRKKRVLYTSLGVVIGVTTIVAVLTIALAGEAKIYSQLEEYGANLMVMPAISDVDIGLVTPFDGFKWIKQKPLAKIIGGRQ